MLNWRRVATAGILFAELFLNSSCQPFHPRARAAAEPASLREPAPRFPVPDVDVSFLVVDDLDRNLELFDCDLPRAGVHPVLVRIHNRGERALDISVSQFSVELPQRGVARLLTTVELVEFLYRSYGIKLYSPHFRERLEADLTEMSLPIRVVTPGEVIEGYLYVFSKRKGRNVLGGATLHWTHFGEQGGPPWRDFHYQFPP